MWSRLLDLTLMVMHKIWPSESEQIKAIKAKMRENRYAINAELNMGVPERKYFDTLIAERERLSEELQAASGK